MKKDLILKAIKVLNDGINMLPDDTDIEVHASFTEDHREISVYDMITLRKIRLSR